MHIGMVCLNLINVLLEVDADADSKETGKTEGDDFAFPKKVEHLYCLHNFPF